MAAAACAGDGSAAPSGGSPTVANTPAAPTATRPLVVATAAGPDGGMDKVSLTANAPLEPDSLPASDVTLEDTNTTATVSATSVTTTSTGLDLLFLQGTLIAGHIYDLTVSAAHLTDRFGQHLPADFTDTFTME